MQRVVVIVGALILVAGAFPQQSQRVIAWSAGIVASMAAKVDISSDQQLIILAVVGLIALAGLSGGK